MNKEALEKRKAQLKAELEKFVAQIHYLNGNIAECDYWLKELQKPAVTATTE